MKLLDDAHEKEMNQKYIFIFLCFILVMMLTLTGLAYRYREKINISQRLREVKDRFNSSEQIKVTIDIVAGINEKSLRLQFSVPCKDVNQKQYIMKRLPRIRHELLMSVNRPEVLQSMEQRDFKAIKNIH
ncbi:hypothetical protein ACFLZG_01925 [Thermodesulfobacteriota bacterium]